MNKKILILLAILALILLFTLPYVFTKKDSPLPSDQQFLIPTPIPTNQPFPRILPTPLIQATENKTYGEVSFASSVSNILPSVAQVYKTSQIQVPDESRDEIARKFAFTTPPLSIPDAESSITYSWRSGEAELRINQRFGYISYVNLSAPKTTRVVSTQDGLNRARKYLAEKRLLSPSATGTPLFSFFSNDGTESRQVDSFEAANEITITFPEQLGETLLYQQYGGVIGTHVTLLTSGEIIRVNIQHPLSTSSTSTPLLSFSEMQERIENGEGAISSLNDQATSVLPEMTLRKTQITSVRVGLMDDKISGYLLPIFVLKGITTDNTGSDYPITIYLPAIKQ